MSAQSIHGLRIGGELVVPGSYQVPAGTSDLVVHVNSPRAELPGPTPGTVVAKLESPAGYTVTRLPRAVEIHLPELAIFEIGAETGEVDATPVTGREEMLPVFVAGFVCAILLGLRGQPVLHASSVALGDKLVAVAGPSGAGKSTVAALLCLAGGALYGDDTARVNPDELTLHRGSCELRLRGSALSLAHQIGCISHTADGRIAVTPSAAEDPELALKTVVFPRWSDAAGPAAARPLRRKEAFELLLSAQRVAGWVAPEPLRANFDACGRIADSIPCLELTLPRNGFADPGLPASVARTVSEALR